MEERLQKILARAGLGSRRACEQYISAGRVRINGQIAELGSKADPYKDEIRLDGAALPKPEPLVYIALHKPRNVLSTVETPDGRRTVLDLVPVSQQVYPVGRLDFESEGLVLLTNDGELANQLTHPRHGHEKEYRVLVARHPDEAQLAAFKHGVVLEDGYRTAPVQVRLESEAGKGVWLRLVLREGRKRQIRETCAQVGLPIVRLIRVRIGNFLLGKLKTGEWRHLTQAEVAALKNPPPADAGKAPRQARNIQRPQRAGPSGPADSRQRQTNRAGAPDDSRERRPRRPGGPSQTERRPARPGRPPRRNAK